MNYQILTGNNWPEQKRRLLSRESLQRNLMIPCGYKGSFLSGLLRTIVSEICEAAPDAKSAVDTVSELVDVMRKTFASLENDIQDGPTNRPEKTEEFVNLHIGYNPASGNWIIPCKPDIELELVFDVLEESCTTDKDGKPCRTVTKAKIHSVSVGPTPATHQQTKDVTLPPHGPIWGVLVENKESGILNWLLDGPSVFATGDKGLARQYRDQLPTTVLSKVAMIAPGDIDGPSL